jgi:hypothetical protein
MQSLGEILRYDDATYLKYLSRKTQYLITRDKTEFIHRFWQHLIVEYHPRVVLPRLSIADKKTFQELLSQFSHDTRSVMRSKYQKLEQKIPWVLKHPEGGYFIPFEIIKTLMPRSQLIAQGYLFQLLYRMPAIEQQSLRAMLARSHRSREALTQEKHQLDRALAIYIWTADHRAARRKHKIQPALRTIWQILLERFPALAPEIEEWQFIMQNGKRGFYRSLSLIRGAEVLKSYVTSLQVVPVTTRRHRVFPSANLRFNVPLEFQPDRTGRQRR